MKVLDLFCGAGGFSKGFEQAGFDIILGIDSWDIAPKNFKLNHPKADAWVKDVATLQPKELPPDIDIIIGGTPCQEFTSLNLKRQPWRGMINICHFLRIVGKYKPKYWLMENVLGLNKYLPEHLNRFKLKASNYGCKTNRRRLFVGNILEPPPTQIIKNPGRTVVAVDNRNKNKSLPKISDLEGMLFEGTPKEIRQLQANSVPPKLAKAVADMITKTSM